MGRTFENRKQAMAKRSDRDAKAFSRAGRQIAMAVKSGGSDPDGNPALRRAMQNARAVNMPKDKVQAAIDKASGANDTTNYEEVVYEGYGPHGIAVLVVTATDNPTRTVANVRNAFKKCGGNMGVSGSVAFMFQERGEFRVPPEGVERDELELELIDEGLEELLDGTSDEGEPQLVIQCPRDAFGTMQSAIEERKLEVASSGFVWVPTMTKELSEEQAAEVVELVDRLEQDDDVQEVFTDLE